jgi:Fibronectin type III domain
VIRFRAIAWSVVFCLALVIGVVAAAADEPTPIARGPHISGVVRYQPRPALASTTSAPSTCSTPGGGNYRTDCNSSGRPVNETSIASNGSLYVAGANDYNSYNGQGQNGYYWSSDGVNWNDAGPIDVFPHNPNNGAGDPGLAIDGNGVVYYSSLFFNFNSCSVGGVELLRRDPNTQTWTYYQIAANSSSQFQDKPAIALGGGKVFVSWTQFGSCSGVNVTSPIKAAVFPDGASSVAPTAILSVPGSTYSQGSSIASDGGSGFWVTWEEWPNNGSTSQIMLAHWDGTTWNTPQKISPAGFTDLPSPLPGYAFRNNSFPALAVVSGSPKVVWTSYDTGTGRAYLYNGSVPSAPLVNSGGHQFFPSISPDGSGGVYVSYSQTGSSGSYDQYLWHGGSSATKVSTASSYPGQDAFFSGQFIGDYNSTISGHPIWTDIRGANPNYAGYEMDSMVSWSAQVTAPAAPVLTATPGNTTVHLSWTIPNDGGSTITNYKIYKGTTSGGETLLTTVSGSTTTYDDNGLTNGQTYYYQVSAVNAINEGPRSNEAPATPQASSVPNPPTNLTATAAKGKGVQLSWTAPGGSVSSYKVYREPATSSTCGSPFSNIASTASTSYKDTSTTRRSYYCYQVTAVNSGGESAPSNPVGPVQAA